MAETSDGLIKLAAGALSVGLAPHIGGSVAWFRAGTTDLMRPLSPENLQAGNVLGVAMFPMVPYANRIANNAFAFGGQTWRFAANNPPEKFNVHGTGWHKPWHAERVGEALRLSLSHIVPGEPYSYEATQLFRLTSDDLTVELTLTNRGPVPMPFGFGLHPWFERDPDLKLRFTATHFFMEGPEGVATERLATPPELGFAASAPLPDTWRNNDYGGWDGMAEISFPSRGYRLTIEADPVFSHLMLYADPERPYWCLEPQSNAPTAFNRIAGGGDAGMGTQVLAPAQSLAGTIRFRPERL